MLTYGGKDFESNMDPELIQHVDADHGSNYHRKSISGYVSTIAGGAVAWSLKKQLTVAQAPGLLVSKYDTKITLLGSFHP
jgi:hypothetical protein